MGIQTLPHVAQLKRKKGLEDVTGDCSDRSKPLSHAYASPVVRPDARQEGRGRRRGSQLRSLYSLPQGRTREELQRTLQIMTTDR